MRMSKPVVIHDDENHITKCSIVLPDNNYVAEGVATCSPKDIKFYNHITGETIAQHRALIKAYKFIKNNEIKPQLQALKDLYYSMNTSKYYNPKSYEAQRLQRHIQFLEEDLDYIKNGIDYLENNLKLYLNDKADFYTKVEEYRAKRSQDKSN